METLDVVVCNHVMKALQTAQGQQKKAATMLGISRHKLARLMKRYCLDHTGYPTGAVGL